MNKINITDIAKELKMSPSTVSRALSGSGRISKKTCEYVKKVSKQLGYVPNIHAQRLLGGPSKIIGVCCSQGFSMSNPDYYMLELIQSLIEATANINHNLIVFNTGDHKELNQKLDSREIDGLIIIVDNPKACITLAKKMEPFPCVILGCPVKKSRNGLSTVSIDRESGAKKATKYLLNLGHKSIGFIRGTPANPLIDDKYEGYVSALETANIKIKKSLIVDGGTTFDSAVKVAKEIIKKNVTAAICETDWIALAFFRAAEALDLKIPDDISVVGFNDCAFSGHLSPPLTTVKIPLDVLANTSVQFLAKMIDSKTNGEHTVISTKLIRRSSTAKSPLVEDSEYSPGERSAL